MQYREILLGLLAGVIATACIIVIMFLGSLQNHTEGGRWSNESLISKLKAIDTLDPDVVILAGSNALLGFSAQRMTEVHKVKTVNLAVTAGLGISYMLDFDDRYFRRGRLFVLPLEYLHYAEPFYRYDPALYYQFVGYDSAYFWRRSLSEKVKLVANMPAMTRFRMLRAALRPDALRSDGYQSQTQNQFGDETSNMSDPESQARVFAGCKPKVPSRFLHSQAAWDVIQAFAVRAKVAGAAVVLTFPNIAEDVLDINSNRQFFSELTGRAKAIGIAVIGRPEFYRFGENAIFDSCYHLNDRGQIQATDRLVQDLTDAKLLRIDSGTKSGFLATELQEAVH